MTVLKRNRIRKYVRICHLLSSGAELIISGHVFGLYKFKLADYC